MCWFNGTARTRTRLDDFPSPTCPSPAAAVTLLLRLLLAPLSHTHAGSSPQTPQPPLLRHIRVAHARCDRRASPSSPTTRLSLSRRRSSAAITRSVFSPFFFFFSVRQRCLDAFCLCALSRVVADSPPLLLVPASHGVWVPCVRALACSAASINARCARHLPIREGRGALQCASPRARLRHFSVFPCSPRIFPPAPATRHRCRGTLSLCVVDLVAIL